MVASYYYTAPELPVAFARNPKCASSAVKISLWKAVDHARGEETYDGRPHIGGPWERVTEVPAGKIGFAVVREPFSRIYSAYTSKMTGRRGERHDERWRVLGFDEPGDFTDFVRAIPRTPIEKINPHWRPQTMLVAENVRRIFRLERADLLDAFLQRKVGQPLGVYRQSRYKIPMSAAYTPETEAIVREFYAADFARFGYSNQLAIAVRRADARRKRAGSKPDERAA